jgi:hypothetical protein
LQATNYKLQVYDVQVQNIEIENFGQFVKIFCNLWTLVFCISADWEGLPGGHHLVGRQVAGEQAAVSSAGAAA